MHYNDSFMDEFEYLTNKRGKIVQEIEYTEQQMAEYLMPNFKNLSISDKGKSLK